MFPGLDFATNLPKQEQTTRQKCWTKQEASSAFLRHVVKEKRHYRVNCQLVTQVTAGLIRVQFIVQKFGFLPFTSIDGTLKLLDVKSRLFFIKMV